MPPIETYALLTVVLLPFLGAFITPYLYRWLDELVGYFAAVIASISFLLVTWLYLTNAEGTFGVDWISVPELGYEVKVSFMVDGLSLFMGFVASGIGILIMVYARGYMHGERDQGRFFAYLLAFMGSMLGVVFAEDLIVLFVFWELTSLTSFLLIGFHRDEDASVYGARKSMIITVSGGLFMLVGFLLLHAVTGTFSVSQILANPQTVTQSTLYLPILLLFLVGATTKSAQVPFHIWLPNAMEAPTPVSAFLHSATMVKAGVFLIGRFSPVFSGRIEWILLVGTIGMITMTIGAILAVQSKDVKELLAYSTVSHLGLITATFGFATKIGAEAGSFHILNHATFKAALFMVAGIVAHAAGTRELDKLGGLRKHMPLTALLAGIASLSMAGVPPFNGFYSKELLYEASLEMMHEFSWGWVFPVVAVVASVFTFLYSIRFFAKIFMGKETAHVSNHDIHSPSLASVVPTAVLIVAIAVISIQPQIAADAIVTQTIESVYGGPVDFHPHLPTELTTAFVMSLITIGLGILGYTQYTRGHNALRSAFRRVPQLRANYYYNGFLSVTNRLSGISVRRIKTGYLRTYIGWLLITTVVIVLAGYFVGQVEFQVPTGRAIDAGSTPLIGILVLTIVASLIVP
ncbi:MAG: proton-conducting transporter membrane subunit, partial [Halobacteria archaeon]|nr:proton-conducting transporter membrane subunit [Halobacteria archaeon]